MLKRKILMAVYNPIEVDGRVKRACASLAEDYMLTLLCPRGGSEYTSSLFFIRRISPPSIGGRVGRLLYFWWSLIIQALQLHPDIVYVHDFFLPFPGWFAARICGAKLVYDAHELIVPDKGERLTARQRLFYRLERFVVKKADLVVAANPERADVMVEHYHLARSPIVVRNIPPMPLTQTPDGEVLREYSGMKKAHQSDVHVVYMGDINFDRGLRVLLEAMALLPSYFKLILVGEGPDLSAIRKFAESGSGARLRVVGSVPHAYLFDVIRQADIGYVCYSLSGLNNIFCAPNKVFEYAQAGLPMVATCQPTIERLFDEHPIGRLVGYDGSVTPPAVADAIMEVANNIAQYRQCLGPFLQNKTWEAEAARLATAVAAILA